MVYKRRIQNQKLKENCRWFDGLTVSLPEQFRVLLDS
jgi:hypothetical protein